MMMSDSSPKQSVLLVGLGLLIGPWASSARAQVTGLAELAQLGVEGPRRRHRPGDVQARRRGALRYV